MTNRSRPMHRQAAYRTRQSRTPRHGFAQTARRPTGDRPTRAFPIAQVMRDRSSRFAACQISARERFARPNARASRASPFDAEALAIRESARPRAHRMPRRAHDDETRPNAHASTADENERTSPIDAASAKPPAAERARKPPKPGVPRGRSGAARDARDGGRAAPLRRHAPGVRFRF
ncbi:hypothetical protein [Burkholderia pseudomallei]|uniref:hypothetical protein n=2 Tax=Burkholderia pseudomallei TaxID=28450 RepID=UPI001416FE88|nr:hypothetical protein [Burkholderia pseudomallei]